jgi:hypothetical protein
MSISFALLYMIVMMASTTVFAQDSGTVGVYVKIKLPPGFNSSRVPISALETMEEYFHVAEAEMAKQEAKSDLGEGINTFVSKRRYRSMTMVLLAFECFLI